MVPVAEVLRQTLQVIHIFREVIRDVRFQDFENAPLPASTLRISPREADHRANAGLGKHARFDFHPVSF